MELITSCLLLTIVILCFIQYLFFYAPDSQVFHKVPGPYKVPIVGNLFDFMIDPVQFFYKVRDFAKKYAKIYSLQVCQYKIVTIYNPEDIEIILSNSKHNTKSIIYDFFHPWLQQGVLLSKGEKWHQRRKILSPAFRFDKLREYCKTFDERSQNLVDEILSQSNQPIDLAPVVTKFTINSLCETTMGALVNSNGSSVNKYKSGIDKMGGLIYERTKKVWLHPEPLFRMSSAYRKQKEILLSLHDFTTSLIRQRRKEREKGDSDQKIQNEDIENDVNMNGTKKRLALLDLLLLAEAEGKIDEMGIREEVDTFIFAGHGTVETTICFCLMILANHKDAQDKIMEELNGIFQDSDRAATMEDLNNMKYLEMCIKENLRLYSSAPFISRKLHEEVQLTNYLIPSGTICFIQIFDLHRDPSIYPSPEDFIPERFTPANCAKRHPFAYIPFSAGPRNCIGQKFAMLEMKSAISRILRNFTLEPVTKPKDIIFNTHLALRSKNPIYVKFVPRYRTQHHEMNKLL